MAMTKGGVFEVAGCPRVLPAPPLGACCDSPRIGRGQPAAGVPANAAGSPRSGMSGPFQLMTSARLSEIAFHSAGPSLRPRHRRHVGLQPHERRQPIEPHPLHRGAVGIDVREERAGQRPEERAGALASEATSHATRQSASLNTERMRSPASSTHALSLVYGSRQTSSRWKFVSHSLTVRCSPSTVVRTRSPDGSCATAAEGSACTEG